MKMQEGFLWGGATAANQCEGSASAGPFAFCPAGLDESAEKQQNSVRMRWNAGQHPVNCGRIAIECVEAQNRCCAVNAAKMKDERGRL